MKSSAVLFLLLFLGVVFAFPQAPASDLITVEWWKTRPVAISGSNDLRQYSIELILHEELSGSVGRSLRAEDFPKIKAIRVRDVETGVIVEDAFEIVVDAQNARLAWEHTRNHLIPTSFYEPDAHIVGKDKVPFFIPRSLDRSGEFQYVVTKGFSKRQSSLLSSLNPLTKFADGFDLIRNIRDWFAFGGSGLTPDLVFAATEEILWDAMFKEDGDTQTSEELIAMLKYRAGKDAIKVINAVAEGALKKSLKSVLDDLSAAGLSDLATDLSDYTSGVLWALKVANLIEKSRSVRQQSRDEAIEKFSKLSVVSERLETFDHGFSLLMQPTSGNIDEIYDLYMQYSLAAGFSLRGTLGEVENSFDAFYGVFGSSNWDQIAADWLEATLSTLLGKTGPLAGVLAGWIREGSYGVSRNYTESIYDGVRCAVALNMYLKFYNFHRIQELQGVIYPQDHPGEIEVSAGKWVSNGIVADRILAYLFFDYGYRYISNVTLYNLLSWSVPTEGEKNRWLNARRQIAGLLSNGERVVGLVGADGVSRLAEKFYAEYEPEAEPEPEPEPERYVVVSPGESLSFGRLVNTNDASRSFAFSLFNNSDPYGWSIAIDGPSWISVDKNSGSGSWGRSVQVVATVNSTQASLGSFSANLNLTINIADEEPIFHVIPVSGEVVTMADLVSDGGEVMINASNLVADGYYSTRWIGREDFLRLRADGNLAAVITTVMRFDLSEIPANMRVRSAEIRLAAGGVNYVGSAPFWVFEHSRPVTDDHVEIKEVYLGDGLPLYNGRISGDGPVVISSAAFRNLVRRWIENPASNTGVMLWPGSVGGLDVTFDSSENPSGMGPALVLDLQHPDNRPPVVTVFEPSWGRRLETNSVVLEGVVRDENGIRELRVNGRRVLGFNSSSDEIPFSAVVDLQPGRNDIRILAVDGAVERNERTEVWRVYRPDFELGIAGERVIDLNQGDSVRTRFSTRSLFGFEGVADVRVSATGVEASVESNEVRVGDSFEVEIKAGERLPEGTFSARVEARSQGIVRSVELEVRVRDGFPPVIVISSPQDGAVIQEETIVLRGSARDVGSSGLRSVWVEGRRLESAVERNDGSLGSWAFELPLEGGSNDFTVMASDHAGNHASAVVEIIHPVAPGAAPVIVWPGDGETHIPLADAIVRWDHAWGAEDYRVEWALSEADLLSEGASRSSLETPSLSLLLPDLVEGTTYYYRVTAMNAFGEAVGEVRSFSTLNEDIVAFWTFDALEAGGISNIAGGAGHWEGAFTTEDLKKGLVGSSLKLPQEMSASIIWTSATSVGFWLRGSPDGIAPDEWSALFSIGPYALEFNGENGFRIRNGAIFETVGAMPVDEWFFIAVSLDFSERTMGVKAYARDEWLSSTRTFPGIMPGISGHDIVFHANAAFAGEIDEGFVSSRLLGDGEFDLLLSRVRQLARFDYTFLVRNKMDQRIPGSFLFLDRFGTFPVGEADLTLTGERPAETLVRVQAANHVFAERFERLPWKDATIMLRSLDDPPYGASLSLPSFATLGEAVQLRATAFDYESGANEWMIAPRRIRTGPDGMLYIVDRAASRVYRTADGEGMEIFCGTGSRGFSGDGESALLAELDQPEDIAWDSNGNAYIADTGNNRVRKIDQEGVISTFAGSGASPGRNDPVGGQATGLAISRPMAVLWKDGHVFTVCRTRGALIRISLSGSVSEVARVQEQVSSTGSFYYAGDIHSLAHFPDGTVWGANGWSEVYDLRSSNSPRVSGASGRGFNGDGLLPVDSGFSQISDLVYLSGLHGGALLLVERHQPRVRRLADNRWRTLVGTGLSGFPEFGANARFNTLMSPTSVTVFDDRLLIADEGARSIFAVDAEGDMQPFFLSRQVPAAGALEFQVDWGGGDLTAWQDSPLFSNENLPVGMHEVRVRARDISGNVSAWSSPVLLEIAAPVEDPTLITTDLIDAPLEIPTGETTIIRGSNVVVPEGDLVIPEGAALILDGASLSVPGEGRILLSEGSSLALYRGSFLGAKRIVTPDLSESGSSWPDVRMRGSQVLTEEIRMWVSSFSIENTRLSVIAKPEQDALFEINASGDISILNDSNPLIAGGLGKPGGSGRYEHGTNGGTASVNLSAGGMVIIASLRNDFRISGGDGGSAGTHSQDPGNAGSGGDAHLSVLGNEGVSFDDSRIFHTAGRGMDGTSRTNRNTAGSHGGDPGDQSLVMKSMGDIRLTDFVYTMRAAASGRPGASYYQGLPGRRASGCLISMESAGHIVIKRGDFLLRGSRASQGGYGFVGGIGGNGTQTEISFDASQGIFLEDWRLRVESSDAGDGGSAYDGRGGVGGIGGDAHLMFTAPELDFSNVDLSIDAGHGGSGGNSRDDPGVNAGRGGAANALFEAQSGFFKNVNLSISSGRGQNGSGFHSYGGGGSGSDSGNVELLFDFEQAFQLNHSSINIFSSDAGSGGRGDGNGGRGGNSGDAIGQIIVSDGFFVSDSSNFRVDSGRAGSGGDSRDSTGGDAGSAGTASLIITAFNSVTFGTDRSDSLFLRAGNGAPGGRGWRPGSASVGGSTSLQIESDLLSLKGYEVLLRGGNGRNGSRGDRERDNKNGTRGGNAIIEFFGVSTSIDDCFILLQGGSGGDGPASRSGGIGGNSGLFSTGFLDVFSSSLLMIGGLPGQSGNGSYVSHGSDNLSVDGFFAMQDSILAGTFVGSGDASFVNVEMDALRLVDTSRRVDFYNDHRVDPFDFVTLFPVRPSERETVWTLIYDESQFNWRVVSNHEGELHERAEFGVEYTHPEIRFMLGKYDYFPWRNNDTITVVDRQPNLALTDGAVGYLDRLVPVSARVDDAHHPYDGELTVVAFNAREEVSRVGLGSPPYHASFPGWRIDAGGYSGVSADLAEVLAVAPGLASNLIGVPLSFAIPELVLYLDSDGDWLPDFAEEIFGTDPHNPDTDGDGLSDWEEIYLYFTDPLLADTDGDGVNDYIEIFLDKTDPLDPNDHGVRPPVVHEVAILPESPLTNDTLTLGLLADHPDIAEEEIEWELKWFRDGRVLGVEEIEFTQQEIVTRGSEWVVSARAYVAVGEDSKRYSEWVESAPVVIGNRAPVYTGLTELTIRSGSYAEIELAFEDAEEDELVFDVGASAEFGEARIVGGMLTYSAGFTDEVATETLRITADDGHGGITMVDVVMEILPMPNLALGSLSFDEGFMAADRSHPVSLEVESLGGPLLPQNRGLVEIRLSKSRQWGNADNLVLGVFDLGSDITGAILQDLDLPEGLPFGSYHLGARVVIEGELEADTTNSVIWSPLRSAIIPSSFDSWVRSQFTEADLAEFPELLDPFADVYGVGTPSLLRYALGRRIDASDSRLIAIHDAGGGWIGIEFERLKSAADVEIFLETSKDLVSWRVLESTETTVSITDSGDVERWSLTRRHDDAAPFIRLGVAPVGEEPE